MKPGITYGATDEFGYHTTENPVHIHDLHATILHQMGIPHERLTFRTQGRDFRLTDVAGKVVNSIVSSTICPNQQSFSQSNEYVNMDLYQCGKPLITTSHVI
jgi:hypothetical protein